MTALAPARLVERLAKLDAFLIELNRAAAAQAGPMSPTNGSRSAGVQTSGGGGREAHVRMGSHSLAV